jgi:PII-like signaling protein
MVNQDCLKLTTYFGERDRVAGGFVADALSEIYARHELQTSLVLRGVRGFGLGHHLRTDRLLTPSEDLPLVSVAVDTRARIEAALGELRQLRFDGLVTLERARMVTVPFDTADLRETTKLTVYVGRHERVAGKPAYETVVGLLQRHGVEGAIVLLGVDGTTHGVRRRAGFFAANTLVPLMIIAVGAGERIAAALRELAMVLPRLLITLERAWICKRGGELLAELRELPESDSSGLGIWQKLMVHAGEDAQADGHPLHDRLVTSLRDAGAAGATSLRGIWGYQGRQSAYGDSFWQLRRRAPMLTVVVDTPPRIQRWFEVIDDVTSEAGVVTSEMVPAFRATSGASQRGGLHLAHLE